MLKLATALQAQAGPLECARIDDATKRLACYDQEFSRVAPLPASPTMGKWQLKSAPSAVPKHTDHTASLVSQGKIQCRWSSPRPVQLRIRCLGNTTSVSFETGCYMTSSQYRSYGDVSYRLNYGETRVARMTAGSNDRSLGFWSGEAAIPFIRELLDQSDLTVMMTPYSDEPVSAVFDLRGINEAIAPVRQECGW